ncbi:Rv1476 family membrane protein [Mycobacterium sp. C3-094]|uniref:Rv1476 family membrane protein n=1 Tax=Mycobacterium sp. PSTR-4-N TaxID=2917745 RepID=UPI001F14E0E5|nr:DUF6676 family protein [Mycobacterium sp. PSTR-4-N]MCG7593541.1 hypothetical protein [Mycobacterium sp. PSTR-4-N]
MTGPHVIPFLPAYIPPSIDMDRVQADVKDDGISVPPADQAEVPALREIVAQAQQQGIDLKVVVIAENPPIDTPLRDIATEVGAANPGSTVLALSPSFAGTFSTRFDRTTLEAGQDIARTGDPVQSTKNFVGELTTPHFPWTAFTIVLVFAVLIAAIGTRVLQKCSKRSTVPNAASTSDD